ncbi:hypothetical protein D1AOALGA4SA_11520 [Olavius algarvensis Delta 1 endosymbiont]|nr:hypothetical protein D1AOALGA4SA_11520 [Olavius algarvensis Delta 1 endosymbiont]
MPSIILLPMAYAGLRLVASSAVGKKVNQGIDESTTTAVSQISRALFVNLVEISINILLFFGVIYGSGTVFDFRTSLTIICSVYVGSLMHSIYKFVRNLNFIWVLIRDYHLNLKRYIFSQIYMNARSKAQEKLYGMGSIKRMVYKASKGPGPDTIAMRVAKGALPLIWNRVSTRLLAVLFTAFLYILIFRMVVAPFLIQETVHFSLFQAFLWPFAYSVDFFFHTNFSNWVTSLN